MQEEVCLSTVISWIPTGAKRKLLQALKRQVQVQLTKNKKPSIKVDVNTCPLCGKKFRNGDEKHWIGCDYCPRWFHHKCVNYQTYRRNGNANSVSNIILSLNLLLHFVLPSIYTKKIITFTSVVDVQSFLESELAFVLGKRGFRFSL